MQLKQTSQEFRKLPYTSYLESQVYMSVLFVLSVPDHDGHLNHDDHLNNDDHLVPDDYHNYDDLGDHDAKKTIRQYAQLHTAKENSVEILKWLLICSRLESRAPAQLRISEFFQFK